MITKAESKINDDRTEEQMKSHTTLIVARDKFMSGWGRVENGKSYCAWACKPEHCDKVLKWVESRSDMRNVRVQYGNYKPKMGPNDHYHVYVVTEGHPSLK